MRLPKPLYEAKPLIYVVLMGVWLNNDVDNLWIQFGFVTMNSWALSILLLRRAVRQRLILVMVENEETKSSYSITSIESVSEARERGVLLA